MKSIIIPLNKKIRFIYQQVIKMSLIRSNNSKNQIVIEEEKIINFIQKTVVFDFFIILRKIRDNIQSWVDYVLRYSNSLNSIIIKQSPVNPKNIIIKNSKNMVYSIDTNINQLLEVILDIYDNPANKIFHLQRRFNGQEYFEDNLDLNKTMKISRTLGDDFIIYTLYKALMEDGIKIDSIRRYDSVMDLDQAPQENMVWVTGISSNNNYLPDNGVFNVCVWK